ncbi:MAG: DUF1624 domain-containing protein [Clostridia bacterium]|nr:DUF1624 domain-containing protein [Clostridia bacterium]
MMQRIDKTKTRYTVLDVLRALAIIAMVVYHTLWDLVYMFGADIPWYKTDAGFVFQQSICWSFILLSGFCFSLGKRKLKRAVTVLVCSLVITAVTAMVMPENIILHGVLSLLGTSMLVTIPLEKIFKKLPALIGLIINAVLFALTYNVSNGSIGFGEGFSAELPSFLYANNVTAFFGFPHSGFYSSDYFPLLPWLFLFWCGYFLYGIFEKKGLLKYLSVFSCKPLEFIGRHSLEIYMAHQPIIYGVLFIIYKII